MTNLTDEGLRETDIFYEQAHEIVKKHYRLIYHGLVWDIAAALQQVRDASKREEREACAKVAENHWMPDFRIADAIRQMDGGK